MSEKTAWEAYEKVITPAREAYEKATAPAREAYEKAIISAWEAYEAAKTINKCLRQVKSDE